MQASYLQISITFFLCGPGKVDLFSVYCFSTLNANHTLPMFCHDTPIHWHTHTRNRFGLLCSCIEQYTSTVHFLLGGHLLSHWAVQHIPVGHGTSKSEISTTPTVESSAKPDFYFSTDVVFL